MKIEATVGAYTHSPYSMQRLTDCVAAGKHDEAADVLAYALSDMSHCDGWVRVGTARITIDLLPPEALHSAQLATLRAKLEEVRAENQQRENAILDAIGKLQALEFVGGAA